MEEVVTNETTGGKKGRKLARFDLIPPGPLTELAEVYGRGSKKYDDRNWEKGYAWGLSFAAMMRHAWAFWGGESLDPQDGQHHLASVAWHAFALMEFEKTHRELDDRPPLARINLKRRPMSPSFKEHIEKYGEEDSGW